MPAPSTATRRSRVSRSPPRTSTSTSRASPPPGPAGSSPARWRRPATACWSRAGVRRGWWSRHAPTRRSSPPSSSASRSSTAPPPTPGIGPAPPAGRAAGAAAAVASGMVPMAHATDSGGSIRVPAGCCGVFGFKPSSGLVATGSEYGPLVGGLNCDHAVTWTVRDSAALLDATAGPEVGAPIPYARPPGSFLAALDQPVGELRIGVATVSPSGRAPAGDIAAGVEATASLLADLGHSVRPWDLAGLRRCLRRRDRVLGRRARRRGRRPRPGNRTCAARRRAGTAGGPMRGRGRTLGLDSGSCRRAGRCGSGRFGWPDR